MKFKLGKIKKTIQLRSVGGPLLCDLLWRFGWSRTHYTCVELCSYQLYVMTTTLVRWAAPCMHATTHTNGMLNEKSKGHRISG